MLVIERIEDLPDELEVELHRLDVLWRRLQVLRGVRIEGVLLTFQEGRGFRLYLVQPPLCEPCLGLRVSDSNQNE